MQRLAHAIRRSLEGNTRYGKVPSSCQPPVDQDYRDITEDSFNGRDSFSSEASSLIGADGSVDNSADV